MSLCTLNLAVSAQPASPLRSAVSRSSLIVYKKKGLFLSSTRKTENIAVNITDGSTPQYNAKRKNRESGWRPSCPFLYRGYTRDAAIRPNKPGSPNFVQLTTMPSDQSPARVDLQTRRCAARFPCYLSDLEVQHHSVGIRTSWGPPEFVCTWISSPRFVGTIWNAAGERFSLTDLTWVFAGRVYPMVKFQPTGAETVVT